MATKKSVARSKARGKATKAGTTPADSRLLGEAGQDAAAAKAPLLVVDPREFESVREQLKELTHTFIGAWSVRNDENTFDEALCRLHEARLNFESCVHEVQP